MAIRSHGGFNDTIILDEPSRNNWSTNVYYQTTVLLIDETRTTYTNWLFWNKFLKDIDKQQSGVFVILFSAYGSLRRLLVECGNAEHTPNSCAITTHLFSPWDGRTPRDDYLWRRGVIPNNRWDMWCDQEILYNNVWEPSILPGPTTGGCINWQGGHVGGLQALLNIIKNHIPKDDLQSTDIHMVFNAVIRDGIVYSFQGLVSIGCRVKARRIFEMFRSIWLHKSLKDPMPPLLLIRLTASLARQTNVGDVYYIKPISLAGDAIRRFKPSQLSGPNRQAATNTLPQMRLIITLSGTQPPHGKTAIHCSSCDPTSNK